MVGYFVDTTHPSLFSTFSWPERMASMAELFGSAPTSSARNTFGSLPSKRFVA